jgi:hypothetical protein
MSMQVVLNDSSLFASLGSEFIVGCIGDVRALQSLTCVAGVNIERDDPII